MFPDILFLCKTKNSDEMVLKTLEWLGYASHHLITPYSPGGGGLALCWKQEINLEVLYSNNNYSDTTIVTHEEKNLHTTFFHGKPDHTKRKEIWAQLNHMGTNRDSPWFLTGDFNEIIDNTEKQGGNTRPESSFDF